MSCMNKNSFSYLFPFETTVTFSLPFCPGWNTQCSTEYKQWEWTFFIFFCLWRENSQSSSLSSHLQTNTGCALQFKESPEHTHLSISDEDCYGRWDIIIQKLESAADTEPDNEKPNLSRIILASKTEARSLIRRDGKLISDSYFPLYITW